VGAYYDEIKNPANMDFAPGGLTGKLVVCDCSQNRVVKVKKQIQSARLKTIRSKNNMASCKRFFR
jgi:hypothetical protein